MTAVKNHAPARHWWPVDSRRLALVAAAWLPSVPLGAAEHVIHISVDGLNASLLQSVIDAGDAENFKRLQTEGAWTANARTDYSHTNTLPNHTSMLTGRPVTQVPGMPNNVHHGYTQNDDPPISETLHNFGNPNLEYVTSAFDVAHDAGLATALYAAKYKFAIYDQSYNQTTGAPHANGNDKIDRFFTFDHTTPPYSLNSHNQFLSDMVVNHFQYTFVHYADTDDSGHGFGWGSAQWNAAVTVVDGYLGDVLELVENDEILAGKTAIVLSTDHGGSGLGHSTATVAANYTIPFFVWGAGVAPGDLYAMNTDTRTNPGASRADYGAAGQPIRNGDTGNLALDLLGLGPVPGSLINVTQDLGVALPGDYSLDGVVDAADYTVWRDGLDSIYTPADYDGWKSHFGQSAGGGSTANGQISAVPEPGALSTLLIGALTLQSRFRWRRA